MAKKKNTPKNDKTVNKANPKANKTSVKARKNKEIEKSTSTSQKFYDQLKLSESYISLVLGAVVVIGASVLFLFFLRESRKATINKPAVLNSSISPVVTKIPERIYIMQENETLWDVAVKQYGDGFRYAEIIEANKFENPDYVPPGTKIIIPNSE